MKKILGLDLGVSSIGWALISENETINEILGMGTRIIPYSTTEDDDFIKGTGESKNAQRTAYRTSRKLLDRYALRRQALYSELKKNNMMPDGELMNLSAIKLYALRNKAVKEQITLNELGRILIQLNQRRGYKHCVKEENPDKKQRDYVASVFGRWEKINKLNWSIGEYFYNGLTMNNQSDEYKNLCAEFNLNPQLPFRIKEQVFPRQAYEAEFETIWTTQQKFYPQILTDELKQKIGYEIIYYQRPLKSQKGLISICEFEGKWIKDTKTNKDIFYGPKVAAKSNPVAQLSKICESINNIEVKKINLETKRPEVFDISPYKTKIFEYLDTHKNMSQTELFKILNIKKNDGYYTNTSIKNKGIQGNLTKAAIIEALDNYDKIDELVQFNFKEENKEITNINTGEILSVKQITPDIENEPLYKLWHVCYSIKDRDECKKTLIKQFNLTEQYADNLAKIDFSKGGYANKSVKAMRKILPYLMMGLKYSDAMERAGFNHSNSLTKNENLNRQLADKLKLLKKNELRQPVVEKILNQMIHLVNAIIDKYGKPDEIRIELARELKQNKEERNNYFKAISDKEKQNKKIAERLEKEYGVKATRKNIEKWRLWHEVNGKCLYCNKQITITEFLKGIEADVEHIIPRSIFYDDSFANKTISHTKCNQQKGNNTAYDFMKQKSENELNEYLNTIKLLHDNKNNKIDEGAQCLVGKIGKAKFERLQWTVNDIPQDFINRQLRETSYIAKKSREILSQICHYVYATSGNITSRLRNLWGYNEVIMNIQLDKIKQFGLNDLIETEEWHDENNCFQKKEKIKDWTKRDDHRHHAIDALVVASTKQGFIQRINTLNAQNTRQHMLDEIQLKQYNERLTLLDKYLIAKKPFTTQQVKEQVEKILISFKPGKKVATKGVRKITKNGKKIILQTGIIVPRGALSEQSVYGKIKIIDRDKNGQPIKHSVKYLFENPHLIFKPYIKALVEERLALFNNDSKKAIASLKKEPIFLDKEKNIKLEYASCYKDEYVIKYPIEGFKEKNIKDIIDLKIQDIIKKRLEKFNNNEKEAFKNLDNNPIWFNEEKRIPIRTIRCYTGLSAVEPVKKDEKGNEIGFVKPGNNHHIAIYIDENNQLHEHCCTFWHAVERKKYGIPVVIQNPKQVWDSILNNNLNLPDTFLEKLPSDKWFLKTSLQQNEMFVLGLSPDEFNNALIENNYKLISKHLYRVQKLSESNYNFRHHLETQLLDDNIAKTIKRYINIQSLKALFDLQPVKVKIDYLGNLIMPQGV